MSRFRKLGLSVAVVAVFACLWMAVPAVYASTAPPGSEGGGATSPPDPISNTCQSHNFFGLPTWYKYLVTAGRMVVDPTTHRCEIAPGFKIQDLTLIALALVDIALRIAAIVTVGYIVYGGVQFVVAQGEIDKTKKARQTIINALIGLVIAMISTGLVAFIGTRIG